MNDFIEDRSTKINLQFNFDILNEYHYAQALSLFTNSFCRFEPMTKYLKITTDEFKPFAEAVLQKAILDKLSIVALHDHRVAALAIVEDCKEPLDLTLNYNPKFEIIFSFLKQLSKNFINTTNIERFEISHLFITAVHPVYFGQHLSSRINLKASELSSKKAYDFMYCEFTHPYNKRGTLKRLTNDQLLLGSCQYNSYLFKNQNVFEKLDGFAASYIWELQNYKKLEALLTHPAPI